MAKAGLSFIGYSDEGKNKSNQHFKEGESGGLYKKIFLEIPKDHHDVFVLRRTNEEGDKKQGRPPAIWMLHSYHMLRLIEHLLPKAARIRSRIRKELKDAGKDVNLANINARILGDDYYRLSFALSMLDHVVLELAGFAIARALEQKWLSAACGQKALSSGVIDTFNDQAGFPDYLTEESILSIEEQKIKDDPALISVRLAVQGIEATLKQPEILSSFRSSERKSRYLQSDQLLREYVEKVEEYDAYFASGNLQKWWKGGSPYQAIARLLS
jgi:hypothetical protein